MSETIPEGMICSHCFANPCACPSSAVPLETMIEEMEQVEIWFDGVWWTRTGSKDAIARSGHSVHAAVSALYRKVNDGK